MWPLSAKKIYAVVTGQECNDQSFESIIISGICQDSRKLKPSQMFIAIKGDNFDGHDYLKQCFQNKLQLALVQKDSLALKSLTAEEKLKCICVENVIDSLRKLAKFMRNNFPFSVIGVGGSNGKTTTKELLYSMLLGRSNKVTKTDKSENGYLGMALTLLHEEHTKDNPPSALVLEIGIDEVGAMQQHIEIGRPNIVLLTALGPEHLAGLKNWETAINEELLLFSTPNAKKVWQFADEKILQFFFNNPNGVMTGDYLVIEKNNLNNIKHGNNNVVIWDIIEENDVSLVVNIEVPNLNVQQHFTVSLPGKHNAANFALAFATALAAGKSLQDIAEGFKKFIPPPMRSNCVTLPNGAVLLNDAYNASPLSVEAALLVLEKPWFVNKKKLVVLADMLDLGSESNYWHESLVPALNKLKHTHLCLYGSAMYSCYKLLQDMKDTLFKENETRVFWLDTKEDPGRFFEDVTLPLSDSVILIKGSRGMKLERVVKLVEEKCKPGI